MDLKFTASNILHKLFTFGKFEKHNVIQKSENGEGFPFIATSPQNLIDVFTKIDYEIENKIRKLNHFYDLGCGNGMALCLIGFLFRGSITRKHYFVDLNRNYKKTCYLFYSMLINEKNGFLFKCQDITKISFKEPSLIYTYNPFIKMADQCNFEKQVLEKMPIGSIFLINGINKHWQIKHETMQIETDYKYPNKEAPIITANGNFKITILVNMQLIEKL